VFCRLNLDVASLKTKMVDAAQGKKRRRRTSSIFSQLAHFSTAVVAAVLPLSRANVIDDKGRNCSYIPAFPGSEGLECTFPFTFMGVNLTKCVPGSSDLLPYKFDENGGTEESSWCAITNEYSNTSSRLWTQWGFCVCEETESIVPTDAPTSMTPSKSPTAFNETVGPSIPGTTTPTASPIFGTASPSADGNGISPTQSPGHDGNDTVATFVPTGSQSPTNSPSTNTENSLSPSTVPSFLPTESPSTATPSTMAPTADLFEVGGFVWTAYMIATMVGSFIFLAFAICLLYYVWHRINYPQALVLPHEDPKSRKNASFGSSSSKVPRGVADIEGYVQTFDSGAWNHAFLVLNTRGALLCFKNMAISNEGFRVYCGELWGLAPGDIKSVSTTKNLMPWLWRSEQTSFVVETTSGATLRFRAINKRTSLLWVSSIERYLEKARTNKRKQRNRGSSDKWLSLAPR